MTPGLVNAHQHITGDPLARSCTPDDLEPGRSIFEWSVPLHANHTGDDGAADFTIAKAASTVTVSCPAIDQTYTGAALEPCTASYTGAGLDPYGTPERGKLFDGLR